MKRKSTVYLTLVSLIMVFIASLLVIRFAVDCTLHVYYVDSNGATITAPKTYVGKWLDSVRLDTKLKGYKLTEKVSQTQKLSLSSKSIVMRYKLNRNEKQIKSSITRARYLGVASQLINTKQIGKKQVDPLESTAMLRVVTSNDGNRWQSQAINYPNVNIRYPRIYKSKEYWLILGDNQILSTNNFSDWNYSKLSLIETKYAGIFNPNLVKSGKTTYIVFQSWTKGDGSDTHLYFAEFNPLNSAIGVPKKLDIEKKASTLQGFSIKRVKGQLVLTGIDTDRNKVEIYRSAGMYNRFFNTKVKQNKSADNLSTVNLMNVKGKNRLYYSSYRVSGSVGWRNDVKYVRLDNNKINYNKANFVSTNTLLTNLSVLEN